MNKKIHVLLFAVGLFSCVGCATNTVANKERLQAQVQLFVQSHKQEIMEIQRNAKKAFGPVPSQWTNAQKQAYLGALLALIRKYQTPRRVVVNNYTPPDYTPSIPYTNPSLGRQFFFNSDGTSGSFIPSPIGSGGTIFRSDGSSTNIIGW